MQETVKIQQNGYVELNLEKGKEYIVTRWYGSSLAIFEEKAFQKYIRKLDNIMQEGCQGRSLIRYFLSAAVTVLACEGDGWQIPEMLVKEIARENEPMICEICAYDAERSTYMPVMLLAAESNIEHAISKTARVHRR
jgi:hypothetical protein